MQSKVEVRDGIDEVSAVPLGAFSLSEAAFACAVALSIFCGLGYIVHALIPAATADASRQAAQALLTEAANIRPKPKEKYTFLTLLLLSPALIAVAVSIQRRIFRTRRETSPVILYLCLAAGAYALAADPYWALFLAPAVGERATWGLLGVVFALTLLASFFQRAKRPLAICAGAAFSVAFAAELAVSLGWRILDARSITTRDSYPVHFDAVAYSAAQIANGGTCLVDVLPQYGCFGEFMAPVLHLYHSSILTMTALFMVLQLVAVLSIVVTSWFLIRNRLLFAASVVWVLPVLDRIYYLDAYYQYDPVRLICPALSLPLAITWRRRRGGAIASAALGIFAGLSMAWNIDSGVVVVGALALFVGLSGSTGRFIERAELLDRARRVGAYAAGAALALAAIYVALCIKSGIWVDVGRLLVFQSLFYGSGAYMLPMPDFPSLWTAFIALPIIALVIFAMRVGRRASSPRMDLTAYLAVLCVGLFAYYTGRSHQDTLALTTWPFVVLCFALVDRGWSASLGRTASSRAIGAFGIAVVLAFGIMGLVGRAPLAVAQIAEHWRRAEGQLPPGTLYTDIAFVREHTHPGERVAILAYNQAALFADTGVRSALGATGIAETLRRADAAAEQDRLDHPDFDQLFLSYALCCGPGRQFHYTSWVRTDFDRIRNTYALVDWSPSGDLMRLVRRDRLGSRPDLFASTAPPFDPLVPAGTEAGPLLGRWGRPIVFPSEWALTLGSTFSAHLRFTLGKAQLPSATLLTDHATGFQGVDIETTSPGHAQLFVGLGDHYGVSAPFPLPPDTDHDIVLEATDGHVKLTVDGEVAYDDPVGRMAPSGANVWVGGSSFNGRELDGHLLDFRLTGDVRHASP